jgi:hypothetical protein
MDVITDSALKIAGLERIVKPVESNTGESNTGESNPGFFSKIKDVSDKMGDIIISKVNKSLDETNVIQTTSSNTVDIINKFAQTFNNSLNDPKVRPHLIEAINNAGEIGSLMVEAGKQPFKEAVQAVADAVPEVSGEVASGAIKIGTDMLAAVPGVGAVVELGKVANDFSKAYGASVEAASDAIETASDAYIVATDNYKRLLRELEEKKNMSKKINNDINNSINKFTQPFNNNKSNNLMNNNPSQSAGRKSRRRITNRKAKSKRVRFAI